MVPALDGPECADYEAIDTRLQTVMPSALNVRPLQTLGVLPFWSICKARNVAWDFADRLRCLSGDRRPWTPMMQSPARWGKTF